MSKTEVRVDFYPHLKKVLVGRNRILSPTRLSRIHPKNVKYIGGPDITYVMLIEFILVLLLLPVVWLLTPVLLILVLSLTGSLIIRRKKRESEYLRHKMPEKLVVDAILKCVNMCRSSSSEVVTYETEEEVFKATCGVRTKCVEYNYRKVTLALTICVATATSLVFGYYTLNLPLMFFGFLGGISYLIYYSLIKPCTKYEYVRINWSE